MKDILDQEITIGDIIFYGTTSRYAEFAVLKVVRLTPKMVIARKIISNRDSAFSFMGTSDVKIGAGKHCVVITNLDFSTTNLNGVK